MEFLCPRHEEGDKLNLLLVVSREQNTYAVFYEWDANVTLREASPRSTRRQLPSEYRLPTLLVPLTKASSFLVASTTSVAVFDMFGHAQPSRCPITDEDAGAKCTPLLTRWARPTRDWLYEQDHDDIYLCREDGKVFYLVIGNKVGIERTFLGSLDCDVDSAFNILDTAHEGGDLILAAGSMGHGGLFVQKARDSPRCIQRFSNWGPITDSVVVDGTAEGSSATETDGDRLFACSASAIEHGAVVEFRRGIEAQIGLLIAQDELANTRDIWTMVDILNRGIYVLTSDPVSSLLVYLPHDFGDEISAVDEAESGLDFGAQTLAAGCTPSGIIIQVTEKAIHLGATNDLSRRVCSNYSASENVVGAAVSRRGSLLITAVRCNTQICLRLTRVDDYEDQVQLSAVGRPLGVDYEPVGLSIEDFDSASFIIVGTSDGKVVVYRISEDGLTLVTSYAIDIGNSDDISRAIETFARISTPTGGSVQRSTLFCGLRSGFLVPFEIKFRNDNLGVFPSYWTRKREREREREREHFANAIWRA